MSLFRDRADAGRRLARELEHLRSGDVLVLALPRGGVPVGHEVARALGAELDVIVARKLGAPSHPEFGVGAIAPGVRVLDDESVRALGLTPEDIAEVEQTERAELERRVRDYRGERPPPRIRERTVIVVDDGVATGGTARAALKSVRAQGARRVVFAAPVGPSDAIDRLRADADEVVISQTPEPFRAVGLWYDDFGQTSDAEVLALLGEARIPIPEGVLSGSLDVPDEPIGLVIFAHGSGSSRFSPRNRYVARVLRERGLATLLLDLLTPEEEEIDLQTRELRFDIGLLAKRLVDAARWAEGMPRLNGLGVGYFGSSTGGGAALVAAADHPDPVRAVVSRGGRPDLAADALPRVQAPTLLLVGERDEAVIGMNEEARDRMRGEVKLDIVPRATHLFEEPGALEEVAARAGEWFVQHMGPRVRGVERSESRR